jgi:uncharacterized membrane protein YphA (DoxX/SURF4 family)
MISLSSVLYVVVWLLVAGLVFWLLNWLISYCGVPDPFAKVARVVLAICAVVVCILLLLGLATGQPVFRP